MIKSIKSKIKDDREKDTTNERAEKHTKDTQKERKNGNKKDAPKERHTYRQQ